MDLISFWYFTHIFKEDGYFLFEDKVRTANSFLTINAVIYKKVEFINIKSVISKLKENVLIQVIAKL